MQGQGNLRARGVRHGQSRAQSCDRDTGESLKEWSRRQTPDFPTSLAVLIHVAQAIERVHAIGLVHRDLKPEHVLWSAIRNEWTLDGFGCTAPAGCTMPIRWSLKCAPLLAAALCADVWTSHECVQPLRRLLFRPPRDCEHHAASFAHVPVLFLCC